MDDETRFRALAESAPAILWITDPTGACTFMSRRWEECTGQPPGAALDAGWLEMLHPDDRQKASDVLRGATERREPFGVDYRLRQTSGEYRWVIDAGRPQLGPGGDFLGFVGAVIDIDDRKRAEIALRRTQQVARFLANASVALTDMSDAAQHPAEGGQPGRPVLRRLVRRRRRARGRRPGAAGGRAQRAAQGEPRARDRAPLAARDRTIRPGRARSRARASSR